MDAARVGETMPGIALGEPPAMSIADGEALARWHGSLRRTFWSRDLPVVTFALPRLSAAHNRSLTARVRALRHACGCASSGFLMSMTVVCLALSFFLSDSPARLPTLAQFFTAVGYILLAGAVGKLAGIGWARWRLITLAADLRTEHDDHSTESR